MGIKSERQSFTPGILCGSSLLVSFSLSVICAFLTNSFPTNFPGEPWNLHLRTFSSAPPFANTHREMSRHPFPASWIDGPAVGCLVIIAALLAGGAVALGYGFLVLFAISVIVLCPLAISHRGILIGLLLLATMNGLPFLNTAGSAPGKFSFQDVAAILLALAAAYWLLTGHPSPYASPLGRQLSTAGWLLLAWWVVSVSASAAFQGVPVLKAAIFGRDFGLFAVLLILLPHVPLTTRDLRNLGAVLAAGAFVYALGQIIATTGLADPGSLIHYSSTFEQSGLIRLYGNMIDLVSWACA